MSKTPSLVDLSTADQERVEQILLRLRGILAEGLDRELTKHDVVMAVALRKSGILQQFQMRILGVFLLPGVAAPDIRLSAVLLAAIDVGYSLRKSEEATAELERMAAVGEPTHA